MFEFVILYIIFNMVTSNNKKKLAYKKKLNGAALSAVLRHCHILLLVCNNEKKLKATLEFTLGKVTFI